MKAVFTTIKALAIPLVFAGSLASITSQAAPALDNLTKSDFDKVIRELSGNATYHSVTGASTLGTVFGFELGLVGGVTSTPDLNTISKGIDPSASIEKLPHASLLAAVSVPYGITVEALLFPSLSVGDVSYQQFGGSVKWTANDLLMLPFNLAVRAFYTQNELKFSQTVSSIAMDITQENSQLGFQLLASPNLPFVEPYIGIGTISATGSLAASGTHSIFGFTTAQKAESSPTSTQFLVGVSANLLVANIGLEYNRAFGTDSYNFKLGFGF